MADLKPCPFCGGKAEMGGNMSDQKGNVRWFYWCGCVDCGFHMFPNEDKPDDQTDAITRWNTRPAPPPAGVEVVWDRNANADGKTLMVASRIGTTADGRPLIALDTVAPPPVKTDETYQQAVKRIILNCRLIGETDEGESWEDEAARRIAALPRTLTAEDDIEFLASKAASICGTIFDALPEARPNIRFGSVKEDWRILVRGLIEAIAQRANEVG